MTLNGQRTGGGVSCVVARWKKIVFDSNRFTAGILCDGVTRLNIDDLFLMDTDGSEQAFLTRGARQLVPERQVDCVPCLGLVPRVRRP